MTLIFSDIGPCDHSFPNVLGVVVTNSEHGTEVRFWFEPSQISTVYYLRRGESVTVEPDASPEPS